MLAFHIAYSINNILLINIINRKKTQDIQLCQNSLSLLKFQTVLPIGQSSSCILGRLYLPDGTFSTVVSWLYNQAQASKKIQSHHCKPNLAVWNTGMIHLAIVSCLPGLYLSIKHKPRTEQKTGSSKSKSILGYTIQNKLPADLLCPWFAQACRSSYSQQYKRMQHLYMLQHCNIWAKKCLTFQSQSASDYGVGVHKVSCRAGHVCRQGKLKRALWGFSQAAHLDGWAFAVYREELRVLKLKLIPDCKAEVKSVSFHYTIGQRSQRRSWLRPIASQTAPNVTR